MTSGSEKQRRLIYSYLFAFLLVIGCGFYAAVAHQCNHGHDHHSHSEDVGVTRKNQQDRLLLPEEMAEEEDLKMMWSQRDHDHGIEYRSNGSSATELSGLGLWIHAMACSLLVSLASLICLILLPLIFIQGRPSKTVVDSLAIFGAGAMLGDAFLHQLPHAFGGEHSHSHDDHAHDHAHFGSSHSHSLKDLSVGLSILGGIVVFLIVEKLVRYVEEFSGGQDSWGHGHHHHHKHGNNIKDEDGSHEDNQELSRDDAKRGSSSGRTSQVKELDRASTEDVGNKPSEKDVLRKRNTSGSPAKLANNLSTENISNCNVEPIPKKESTRSHSNLVFGYLNLFSDGVHNFTDGMALGSAFLLYGSVGGWSRTLFLLAHELPQEIGDFGILVRSGFSVSKALFFNFLSALVALAGTALALMWGKDPGQSSLIEGFTAGGFIYIALAGVLAEMNNGTSALRHTAMQLISLVMGISVALCISLVE